MKSALRIVKKVVLWSLVVVFVLVATLYAVNSRDERLSPEAISLLKAPFNPYPPGDNLYLMLCGLHASPGTSVIAAGQAAVRTYEAKLPNSPESVLNFPDKPAPGSLVFKGKVPSDWWAMGTLWREAPGHKAEIQQLLVANRVLYHRYEALRLATGYYSTETPSADVMPPYLPDRLRLLFLANFALRMQSADAADRSAALADMANDIQVWRRVLAGYGSMGSKGFASNYLSQDFLVIGYLIADQKIRLPEQSRYVHEIVTPFPASDWKIGSAFAYNFRVTAWIFNTVERTARRPNVGNRLINWASGQLFYKLHATENLAAKEAFKVIALVDGPPLTIAKSLPAQTNGRDCFSTLTIRCLYNPVGKTLVAIGAPAYEYFPLRVYDVAALQRMVKLAYEIRIQRVPYTQIPSFMKRHPQWATHPVGGREFIFNRVKRQLSVERLGDPSKIRYFTIPVWTRPSQANSG